MILEIVSPEAKLSSGEVTSVTVPGVDGRFQILNLHAPIVSLLEKGLVKFATTSFNEDEYMLEKFTKVDDQNYTITITSGTLEMKDNKIIVLVD